MASTANPSLLGANSVPKVVALTGLGTLALLVDLPELCVLGGLVVYAVASRKKADASEWCEAFANHRIFDTVRSRSMAWFAGALLVAVFADILMQFFIALLSAVAYIVLYEYGRRSQPASQKARRSGDGRKPATPEASASSHRRRSTTEPTAEAKACVAQSQTQVGSTSCPRTSSVAEPVGPPRTGLDGEIHELARSSTPTKADDAVARQLVKLARKSIFPVVPEADIRAIPGGNLTIIAEAGARPEVEMVVTVDPTLLADRLKAYFLKGQTRVQKSLETLHPDVLRKTATKCLSERLTFVRFWRSQFGGPEPLIVLLVPVEMGIFSHPIRLNFSVNTPYPLRLSTIMSKESMRSKELIMFVARWARERCVANMSRGQPHCYAWALFVIYFLRNGRASEEGEKTTADLFKDFVEFYASWFDRRDEPVSISFSKAEVQPSAEGALWGVPYIEDPFDETVHAGTFMTADGVMRVKEELARARTILEREGDAKLAELLERWAPPTQSP